MGLLVCGRSDLGEEYLCELVGAGQHGHAGTVDPIVRVVGLLRYPRQRAIAFPDIVSEVSPVPPGTVCRLPVIRKATISDRPLDVCTACKQLLRACRDEAERAILERHLAGEFRPRKSLRTYKDYELDAARKAWAEVEHAD